MRSRVGIADGDRLEPRRIGAVARDRNDHGQVAARVGRDDLGVEFLLAGCADDQLAGPAHHVKERQDLAVVADDHARAEIERDHVRRVSSVGVTWLGKDSGRLRARLRPRTASVSCPFSFLLR